MLLDKLTEHPKRIVYFLPSQKDNNAKKQNSAKHFTRAKQINPPNILRPVICEYLQAIQGAKLTA